MTRFTVTRITGFVSAASVAALLSGCGTLGDTDAVKQGYELAIACDTDAALRAVDRASSSGGVSREFADLQRVVILRDAGRTREAAAALAERNVRVNADAEGVAKAENSVVESVERLRAERMKETGRRTCP